jgi:predicted glycosyltransferase
MIYSQDGLGLGHLRRTSNIARAVLERAPDCAVLVVSDSPVSPFFSSLSGTDHLKLPTIIKKGEVWHNRLPLTLHETLHLRSRLILEAFEHFRPDAVLVDHLPVGALGELVPLIDRATEGQSKLFFGLRDVMDAPEVVSRLWSEVDAYTYLERYDAVLTYGCRHLHDVASTYGVSSHAHTIFQCNYVVSPPVGRVEPGAPDRQLVVALGGGGCDAFPLAAAFVDALPLVQQEAAVRGMVFPGPTMPVADRRLLLQRATHRGVEVRSGYEDPRPWLSRAAAVVTMAGYNSLCESLREAKKILTVPRAGPSHEQRIRSRLFEDRHLVAALAPETLTPARLASELLVLLANDRLPEQTAIPPMNGAQRAAALLVGGSETSLAPSSPTRRRRAPRHSSGRLRLGVSD